MRSVLLGLAQFSHYSDILRGRLIGALADRCRVVVLTPVIDQARARRDGYPLRPGVAYERIVPAHPRLFALADKYLRVPLVRSFDHLVYMRHFYERPHAPLRKLLMRGRVFLPRALATTGRFTRLEERLAKPSAALGAIVRHERPRALLTATPGFTPFEAELIVAAKRLGIATMALDINYDNLTSNGKLIRKTGRLAVWNDGMAREARELHGYRDDELVRAGCLRFDHYFTDRGQAGFPSREAFLRSKGLDPKRPTVVLAGPTPQNYPPRRELVETLLGLRARGRFASNPNLLVRIHPIDRLDIYDGLSAENLAIERAGRSVLPDSAGGQKVEMNAGDLANLTATLCYADVVLNFASTVIIEAAIFDRPVINIGFPAYRRIAYEFEYNKALLDTGAARLAESPEDLAGLVDRYLEEPGLDREARRGLLQAYVPFRDGQTYVRTAEAVGRFIDACPV